MHIYIYVYTYVYVCIYIYMRAFLIRIGICGISYKKHDKDLQGRQLSGSKLTTVSKARQPPKDHRAVAPIRHPLLCLAEEMPQN